MTEEQYVSLKEDYIEHLVRMMSEMGGLPSHLTVFADHLSHKDCEKPAVIHMIIPEEDVETEDAKDRFVDEKLPDVFRTIQQDFKPYCVAWASEAWLRVADANFDIKKENWKALPIKKEVVIVSMEKENSSETIIYNIHRNGKKVVEGGDIVDNITLELNEDLKEGVSAGGRFTGLFRKFKNI